MPNSLQKLLRPKSIALFGGAWATNVAEQISRSNYEGEVWPIHPTRKLIGPYHVYKSIDQLPSIPDAVFLGVNRFTSVDLVAKLSKLGVGGVSCFASGFAETGKEGLSLQKKIVKAAGKMPILGPNCYGFLNYLDNIIMWPDQHGGRAVENGVGIIAQSSNIAINLTMQKRSLPIAYILTTGNQAQTGISEIALNLLEDHRVTALGFYLEAIDDVQKFEIMAHKAKKVKKPIIILKAGQSLLGQNQSLSHTASITGSPKANSAMFRRLGITEVKDLDTFLETLKVLHFIGPLKLPSIASISCSGGEASLMADIAMGTNIEFSSFSRVETLKLAKILGPIVQISNPLDYHTFIWGDEEKMTRTFTTILKASINLFVFILDMPRIDRCNHTSFQCALTSIIAAKKSTGANVAVISTISDCMTEEIANVFINENIVPLCGLRSGILAISSAIEVHNLWLKKNHSKILISNLPKHNLKIMQLDEFEAKKLLSNFGINVPKNILARTQEDLLEQIAHSSVAFPLVAKALGIYHKSDVGAIYLNISNSIELSKCVERMPSSRTGILVEEMVENTICELLIGIVRDEIGIFTITIGMGGILTELLNKATNSPQVLTLPATMKEIELSLKSLPISKLFSGYRGIPKVDSRKVAKFIKKICDFSEEHKNTMFEIEINPLIIHKKGITAVDAQISGIKPFKGDIK